MFVFRDEIIGVTDAPPPVNSLQSQSQLPQSTSNSVPSKMHTRAVTAIKFSPTQQLVASASADKLGHVYRVPAPSSSATRDADAGPEDSMPVDAANSAQDAGFLIQEPSYDKYERCGTLTGHELGLNDICWWNDAFLCTCSDDKSVKVWDISTVGVSTRNL
jgi:WD40 repeat protein